MTIRARLEALVSVAPPDATLTVRWLAELLAAETGAADVGIEAKRKKVKTKVQTVKSRVEYMTTIGKSEVKGGF